MFSYIQAFQLATLYRSIH